MNSNLYAHFQSTFALDWQAPALVDENGSGLSYGELDMLSARFAAALGGRGVGPGDRVVVQVEKSVGAVALYLA